MGTVLKKAREAASRKRRQKEQLSSDRGKKPRIALGADNQLFRGKKKSLLFALYIHMCFGSACASYYISRVICLYYGNLRVKWFTLDWGKRIRTYMYSPLLFQVISRSCFRFAPAAPFIIISTYILRCLLITIHARGSIQLIYHSGSPLPPSRLLQVSSLLLSFRP